MALWSGIDICLHGPHECGPCGDAFTVLYVIPQGRHLWRPGCM